MYVCTVHVLSNVCSIGTHGSSTFSSWSELFYTHICMTLLNICSISLIACTVCISYGHILQVVSQSPTLTYNTHSMYNYVKPVVMHMRELCICSDETIRRRCGPDSVVYLSLERHIILLLSIFSLLSLVVILPVNVHGDLSQYYLPLVYVVHIIYIHFSTFIH